MATARPYRGVSADDRKASRREALVAATLDVVGRDGVAAATVETVCAEAGLTKRYFYESFADRDALFEALIDAMLDGVRERIGTALAGAGDSAEERTRLTADALVSFFDADRRQARLYIEAPVHPALNARREASMTGFADLIMGDVLGVDTSNARVQLAGLLVVGGTTEVLSRWLAGEIDLTHAEVVDEITRIGLAVVPTTVET
jgi:AcrR family transcriptional regulator